MTPELETLVSIMTQQVEAARGQAAAMEAQTETLRATHERWDRTAERLFQKVDEMTKGQIEHGVRLSVAEKCLEGTVTRGQCLATHEQTERAVSSLSGQLSEVVKDVKIEFRNGAATKIKTAILWGFLTCLGLGVAGVVFTLLGKLLEGMLKRVGAV